jgi:hypothetical protein
MLRVLIIACFPLKTVEPSQALPAPATAHRERGPEGSRPSVRRDYEGIETQLQCGIFDNSRQIHSVVIIWRKSQGIVPAEAGCLWCSKQGFWDASAAAAMAT